MADDDSLEVDDLVTGKAAEQLGDGVIPVKAVLVVETVSEEGTGMRYVLSNGLRTWHAIGMLRSSLLKIENDDLRCWQDSAEDD